VPGLSQRPIQPGHRFLYKWKAEESGSYFYHSHSRSQINDGLFGAIYIEPNDCVDKPFDTVTEDGNELQKIVVAERNTQPVLLSDWTLLTSEEVWQAEEATGLDAFCVNAMLINGKGSVQCLEQDRINELATPAMRAVLQNHTLTDMA
jgi:FtsP/CotA-like multicopper oxidase with cupredoxin domain